MADRALPLGCAPLGFEPHHEIAQCGCYVGSDRSQRWLGGTLPDQVVSPFAIDRGMIAQPTQRVAISGIQRLAAQLNCRIQWTPVPDHHAVERCASNRSRRAIVVYEPNSLGLKRGPRAESAAIAADSLVEQQAHHGAIVPVPRLQINGTRTDYTLSVSLFRRMFSADYRAAVAAEAAGNVDAAAQRYALAGELEGAVRMHIARAARATTRQDEIAALRDALRWAGDDPVLRSQASRALGRALLETATLEGIATERDRARVREAADLLIAGGDCSSAGEALETIGDLSRAAHAYSTGGLIEKLEAILAKESEQAAHDRDCQNAFNNYETYMRVGQRDAARGELVRALTHAGAVGSYRRLLDQLDSALLTGGRIEFQRRNGRSTYACTASKISIGRDALCDLPLRASCVSRHHAVIDREQRSFLLRDGGSRNGTSLEGMPLVGTVPLVGRGRFSLGNECTLGFEVLDDVLVLSVADGVDQGLSLIASAEDHPIDLRRVGLPLEIAFRNGRPVLGRGASTEVSFNGESLADVRVQLIRGDRVVADGNEIVIG